MSRNFSFEGIHDIKSLLFKKIKLFNFGYIKVLDVMGNDDTIANTARISYGKHNENFDSEKNRKLTARLWIDQHLSPFEMPKIQIEVKCPMFVANQWKRHRMANYNEQSLRYTKSECHFYMPEKNDIRTQSKQNHQGSDKPCSPEVADMVLETFISTYEQCHAAYNKLIEHNVSRELSRSVLPAGLYVTFITCIDLRSLLNFLNLRMSHHAQYEIRVYAETLFEILKIWLPHTASVFQDTFYATKMSGNTVKILSKILKRYKIEDIESIAEELKIPLDALAEIKYLLQMETKEF